LPGILPGILQFFLPIFLLAFLVGKKLLRRRPMSTCPGAADHAFLAMRRA
jgi:hypothetical protein